MKLRLVVVLLLALAVADASAQMRRDRSASPRGEARDRQASRDTPSPLSIDPFAALERELPSLQVDLLIRAEQLDDWRVFERDVRDIAEMERTRRRHLLALRDAGEKQPTAIMFIGSIVEDDRLKAEASADLKRHVEALYSKLDDSQRRTFDRRMIQSQTEPLGTNSRN